MNFQRHDNMAELLKDEDTVQIVFFSVFKIKLPGKQCSCWLNYNGEMSIMEYKVWNSDEAGFELFTHGGDSKVIGGKI